MRFGWQNGLQARANRVQAGCPLDWMQAAGTKRGGARDDG